jgi:hypothetical protein
MTAITRERAQPRPALAELETKPAATEQKDVVRSEDRAEEFGVRDAAVREISLAAAEPKSLKNGRFADDPRLERVAAGKAILGPKMDGPAVEKIQRALIALGYKLPAHGADGTYGEETVQAVARFQKEMKLSETGVVGRRTLAELDRMAPPPGFVLERRPDYDRLLRDHRLDVTLAIGYDEHGTTEDTVATVRDALAEQKYQPLDEAKRRELGVEKDPPGARSELYHKTIKHPVTKRDVDVVVRLLDADEHAKPEALRASFERALERDEVVIYGGHARYGTGPDFDPIDSGRGNFVVDPHGNYSGKKPPKELRESIAGRESELDQLDAKPEYQMLVFNACSTENYLHALRSDAFSGRNEHNTDIVATTIPTQLMTNGDHVARFLEGITNLESMNAIIDANDDIEWRQGAYVDSGLLTNRGNKHVPER